jgi:hypothetical protein
MAVVFEFVTEIVHFVQFIPVTRRLYDSDCDETVVR